MRAAEMSSAGQATQSRLVRHDFDSSSELARGSGRQGFRQHFATPSRRAAGPDICHARSCRVGSTPVRFFEALSTREIDWPKVTVALVDERFRATGP